MQKTIFYLTLISLVLVSCNDQHEKVIDKKLNEKPKENLYSNCKILDGGIKSCQFEHFECNGDISEYHDKQNDVEKDFIDLTDLSITYGKDCLLIAMSLRNVPDLLTINHDDLKLDMINYTWNVFFDIDENEQPSEGDLEISLDHYKFEENSEKQVKFSDIGLGHLIELQSGTTAEFINAHTRVFFNVNTRNNEIQLYLPFTAFQNLKQINKSTSMQFSTQYSDGINKYGDNFTVGSISIF